jgi:DNA-binding transcriptional LysR family regulator
MELFPLRVFLAVASEKSFSRAAQKLFRTQSAVSQSVRRLEEELKEPLFDRSTKAVRLTEAGKLLAEHAERIVGACEEAESAVADLRELRQGRVVLGANEAALEILLPLIDQFRKRRGAIEVDVHLVAARTMGLEVSRGSLDFGLVSFHPEEPDLRSVIIGADELVVLTHPRHPLASRSDVSLEEFGRETVIAHGEPSPTRERVLRWFDGHDTPLAIRLTLPSLAAVLSAVEQRMGIALLPRRSALAQIKAGRLVAIRVPQLRLPRDIRLIYRRAGNYSRGAREFLALAQKWRAAERSTKAPSLKVPPPRSPAPNVRRPRID